MHFIHYIWCIILASSIYKKWLYKKRIQVLQFPLNERYVWMKEGQIKVNQNQAVKFVDKNVKNYGFSLVMFLLVWLVTCIWVVHWSDDIWASWRLKSPATQLLVHQLAQVTNKGNHKGKHYWPFARGRRPDIMLALAYRAIITMTS